MALDITLWMRDELARRKDLYRDRFAGKPLARVPVDVRVCVPSPAPCTVQEQFRDGDKQLEAALSPPSTPGGWTGGGRHDVVAGRSLRRLAAMLPELDADTGRMHHAQFLDPPLDAR